MNRSHCILWNYSEFFEINHFNVQMYLRSEQEILHRLSKAAECAFAKNLVGTLSAEITKKLEKIEETHLELNYQEYMEILNTISKKMAHILDYFDIKMFH
ncbi:MAG: hypothetical protein ACOC44_03720 [Promethearchaeia archaeon]